MNRHELRERLVVCTYQSLLLDRDIIDTVKDNFDTIDPYMQSIASLIKEHKQDYIARIEPHLNKWRFARLSYVDQAILLVAMAELQDGTNDKAVIINEAITIAKTYCDEDSYRYINSVLDQV